MFRTVTAALVVATVAGGQPPPSSPPPRSSAIAAALPPPTVEVSLAAIDARLAAIESRLDAIAPPRSSPTATPAAAIRADGYPVRPGPYRPGCPDWRHLDQGEHRGQFSRAWLQTLTAAEVQSLHTDAHEGRVNWSYAVRPDPAAVAVATVPAATFAPSALGVCAGGTCPTGTRRLLFRR